MYIEPKQKERETIELNHCFSSKYKMSNDGRMDSVNDRLMDTVKDRGGRGGMLLNNLISPEESSHS